LDGPILTQSECNFRYPWEAAFTGTETTQYCCLEVAEYQHHITASIAHAVRQHMAATRDIDWFQKEGCFIAYNTAKFWASRVTFNNRTGHYDINSIPKIMKKS
jgi:trehalose/maltose hydrolase-like predicted phosphorylase